MTPLFATIPADGQFWRFATVSSVHATREAAIAYARNFNNLSRRRKMQVIMSDGSIETKIRARDVGTLYKLVSLDVSIGAPRPMGEPTSERGAHMALAQTRDFIDWEKENA